MQAFAAGIIRSISDYFSENDAVDPLEVPEQNKALPIPYKNILESIEYEYRKDFWMDPFREWIKRDRLLFFDEKYANDGFNWMYLDLFEKLKARQNSGAVLTEKEKELLREDIIVNEENVGELAGEIAMYRNLLGGKLGTSNFRKEQIDNQLIVLFNHNKKEHRDKLRQTISERIKS